MEYLRGQFLPVVDYGKCTGCGLCLEMCPGIDLDPFDLRHKEFCDSMFDGPWLHIYTAHINDLPIRRSSTSGGLVTGLVVELIKNREFDAAFVLPFSNFGRQPVRLRETAEIGEVLDSAGSKYIPASVYDVIKALQEPRGSGRFIVVGTPCQIRGIKRYMTSNQLSGENLLFLGLFCDKTLNFNIIRYFEDAYARPDEKLVKFEFRTKEGQGWPGNSKLRFNSGRKLIVDRRVRMCLKGIFQLKRCLFCSDKLNQMADISFGDCYVEGEEDFHGKSSVIVRTARGNEVFDKYSHLFTLKRERVETIRRAQQIADRNRNLEYMRIFSRKNNLYSGTTSPRRSGRLVAVKLCIQEKLISWGEDYQLSRIKLYLAASRALMKLNTAIKMATLAIMLGVAVLRDLLCIRRRKEYVPDKAALGNIVIIGGGLRNKGAQAMLFTTVDQMKRRFLNKEIYLLSSEGLQGAGKEESLYKFTILPWDILIKMGLLGGPHILLRRIARGRSSTEQERYVRRVIQNAHYFVDISGYALSSQWGFFNSIGYLLNIMIAKRFSVAYYIFPQSIGPFNYHPVQRLFLYPLLKLYLPYPRKIFAREEDGVKWVHKFTRGNVAKSCDIVLIKKSYDLDNIYVNKMECKKFEIAPCSVAVIPNQRVLERITKDAFYSIYCSIIRRLLIAQRTVYLLTQSDEDLWIIEELKSLFAHEASIMVISDDVSAVEFEKLVGKFDFIITSRYHSIVHAYKSGVPALVIGWAGKYRELLGIFGQQDYYVDVRHPLDRDEVITNLEELLASYERERKRIADVLTVLSCQDIFDTVGSKHVT
jgi:coenzyme F420-reducing hydrogenase beta subunit/polysaccharide pyruvyl transferase WcaK-like protein